LKACFSAGFFYFKKEIDGFDYLQLKNNWKKRLVISLSFYGIFSANHSFFEFSRNLDKNREAKLVGGVEV
jgi:hypothetical protein